MRKRVWDWMRCYGMHRRTITITVPNRRNLKPLHRTWKGKPPPCSPWNSPTPRYKIILRADAGWDGIGYCRSFDTKDGEWQTVDLPFSEFIPVFRSGELLGFGAEDGVGWGEVGVGLKVCHMLTWTA